ncbi:hypothetical protein L9W92_16095, partial [Pelotomaculum terephthalicicum JT]|uniref:hypothetical protein n=1 Tax=Pelotomaculum terephthalicicum TaxID=206393 RepID=UPI001F041154
SMSIFDSPAHSTSFMNNYTIFGQKFWTKSPSALLQTDFFSALFYKGFMVLPIQLYHCVSSFVEDLSVGFYYFRECLSINNYRVNSYTKEFQPLTVVRIYFSPFRRLFGDFKNSFS